MTTPPTSTQSTRPRAKKPGRRLARWVIGAAGLGVLGLIAGEGVLRFGMGLGDPPLYELDSEVEYMLRPSRTYHRFGNTFSVNSFSMRSPEISPSRKDPKELRVLVLGDSIVNGGAKVDQKDLATELLKTKLSERLKRPVMVANASAGSWGPVNQLAYVKLYGLFDADIVVQVLNSADADDVPGLEGIGTQWPREKPALALQEVLEKYAPKLVEKLTGRVVMPPPARAASPAKDRAECLSAVRELAGLVRAAGATYVLVQYQTRSEITGSRGEGHGAFRELAQELSAPRFDTASAFESLMSSGDDPFLPGDSVHAGPSGQRALADVLAEGIAGLVEEVPAEQIPTGTPSAP
jgi:hypothetical protein